MKVFKGFLLALFLTIFILGGAGGVWANPFSDGWRDQLNWIKKSAAYTAHPGDNVLLDTTSAGVTITLPAAAKFGDEVRIVDSDATFDSNNCTIDRNGHNIRAAASDLTLSTENQAIHLFYVDSTVGWAYTSTSAGVYDPSSVAITGGTINGTTIGATTPSTGKFSKVTIAGTSEPALVISQTGISGTDNQAIDISGGEALAAEEHYTAIRIKPDDIDPSGADTRIRGMAINLSGVATANGFESCDGLRISMPAYYINTHAIHLTNGSVGHDYTALSTAGATYGLYDIVIDASSLNAASGIHALNVNVSGGAPAGEVAAVGTYSNVSPIHQHIGSFTSPSQTEYAGEKTGGGVTWADGIDTSEIFVVNSDAIYMGSTAVFSEIEVIMTTPGTKTVSPTFWYNTAADTWTQFYPTDNTDGFQQSGSVAWTLSDISGSWTNDGDPGAADSSAGYWIKIVRTAAPDPGSPTPTTVKTGVITVYDWDETGDLSINGLTVADTITLDENDIKYDENLSADGTYSGTTCVAVMGATLAYGDLVYMATGDQRWELADADAEATAGDVMLGIVITGGNDGDTGLILLHGFIREDDWNFTSFGQALYVHTTDGDMVQTAPSGATDIVRVVGYAHDNADTIYFCPCGLWVEIAA